MSLRRAMALALVGASLVPATATAQSAGDDQYEDPFGGGEEPAPPAAEQTPQPAEPEPTDPAPAEPSAGSQGETAAGTPTVTSGAELPRTGANAGLLGGAGVVLVLAGTVVRLRLRADGAG
jgi:hypothetical protein